jgi:hypothetical protein
VTTIVLAGSAPNILSPLYTVVPMGYTVSSGSGWKTTKSFALTQPGQYMAMSCFGGNIFCYDTLSFWVTEHKVKPVFDSLHFFPKGFLCLYNLDHPQFVNIKVFTKGYATQWTSSSGAISNNNWANVTSTGPFTVTTFDSGTDCPHDTVLTVPDFRINPTLTVQPQYTLCNTPSIAISATVGWHPDSVKVEWKEVIDWQPDKVWGTGTLLTVWDPGTYTVYATNQYGCYVSKKVLVLGCVGVGEITDAPIQTWPNPAANELFVSFSDDNIRVVNVMNSFGQELKRVVITRETVLELSGLPPGLYFLRWEGRVKKLIKQ